MFHEIIDDIANRMQGVQNIIIAATDGIMVSKLAQRDEDELMVVEAASLIKECQRFGSELESGELRNLVFTYKQRSVVIQLISEDYFLMGICSKLNWTAKLKYLLKVKSYDCYRMID